MQLSQIPARIQEAFAVNGLRNNIPVPSQVNVTPGAASFNDGFPAATMQPISSGGVPPSGKDMNGILYAITLVQQWQSAGGGFTFDATFAASIGGYPAGATLLMADGKGYWINTFDGNSTNPDATDGSAANWAPLEAYGIAAITGLTNANVTLTPAQYGKPIITLAGALTGNVQIILPAAYTCKWTIVNNTTGAFSVTAKTAGGGGVVLAQGAQNVYCDGVNIASVGDGRYLQKGLNLSDLANAATARSNLGLGSMATQNATAVAMTGGSMDGVSIGQNAPAPGTFSSVNSTGNVTASGQVWGSSFLLTGNTNGLNWGGSATDVSGKSISYGYASAHVNTGNHVFYNGKTNIAAQITGTSGGGRLLVNGAADNNTDAGQFNGTVSASAGTSGNQVVNYGQFGSSLTASGYQKLPNGNIRQWGTFQMSSSGAVVTTNFPIAFPNACFGVLIVPLSPISGHYNVNGTPAAASFGATQDFSGATSYFFIAEGK